MDCHSRLTGSHYWESPSSFSGATGSTRGKSPFIEQEIELQSANTILGGYHVSISTTALVCVLCSLNFVVVGRPLGELESGGLFAASRRARPFRGDDRRCARPIDGCKSQKGGECGRGL